MRNSVITIIPAYNEERTISKVINLSKKHCHRVLVIDDGSTDKTLEFVKQTSAEFISNSENKGNSYALLKGFEYAITNNYSIIVTIDADLAHNPNEIPKLLNKVEKSKCQLCIGNRFSKSLINNIPSPKICSNLFASQLFNLIMKTNYKDVSCGFRAIKIKYIENVIHNIKSNGFSLVYDMLVFAIMNKINVGIVPVSVHYDASKLIGTSRKELVDLLNSLIRMNQITKEIEMKLLKIKEDIKRFSLVSLKLRDCMLYLIPLKQYDSYIFQKQDEAFNKNSKEVTYQF